MYEKTIGFIGGGRITRIMLEGFKRKGLAFKKVLVSDINPEALKHLKEKFPDITISSNNNLLPASGDIVFIALHPPAVLPVLDEVKSSLQKEAILVSLAPKISILRISERLEGFKKIVRMIPNACSIVNHGFNPMAFSPRLNQSEKKDLRKILTLLGECPEVEEEKLEAYAILSAMGPTYLWFQLYELEKIGTSFGLIPREVRNAVFRMAEGAAMTMYESDLVPDEVMDLIPVKPLGEEEENIKRIYRSKLEALYKKLKG